MAPPLTPPIHSGVPIRALVTFCTRLTRFTLSRPVGVRSTGTSLNHALRPLRQPRFQSHRDGHLSPLASGRGRDCGRTGRWNGTAWHATLSPLAPVPVAMIRWRRRQADGDGTEEDPCRDGGRAARVAGRHGGLSQAVTV